MNNQLTNKKRKYNSVRHGVLTKVILPDEVTSAKKIEQTFMDEYDPQTLTERLLVLDMVVAYIRKQRAINAEKEYMLQILNPAVWEERVVKPALIDQFSVTAELYGEKEVVITKEGYKAKFGTAEIDVIDKTFARYINTCERQYFRALHELQRVQAVRKGLRPTSVAFDIMSENRSEE